MARRFVALDRDGTIIVERHYLADPAGVELLPGAAEGLSYMRSLGLGLVVITNQSGVGRGFFHEEQLALIHDQLRTLLAAEGIYLDGLYYCRHAPEDCCYCRKPKPGMLERAAKELGFDAARSFVVGDNVGDIELGQRVGATTLLTRTGYGSQVEARKMATPHHIVDDLCGAAHVIECLLEAEAERRSAVVEP